MAEREYKDYKDFTMPLYTERMRQGISQAEMAKLAGLGVTSFSRIESGQHNTSLESLKKIAKVLKVKLKLELVHYSTEEIVEDYREQNGLPEAGWENIRPEDLPF